MPERLPGACTAPLPGVPRPSGIRMPSERGSGRGPRTAGRGPGRSSGSWHCDTSVPTPYRRNAGILMGPCRPSGRPPTFLKRASAASRCARSSTSTDSRKPRISAAGTRTSAPVAYSTGLPTYLLCWRPHARHGDLPRWFETWKPGLHPLLPGRRRRRSRAGRTPSLRAAAIRCGGNRRRRRRTLFAYAAPRRRGGNGTRTPRGCAAIP